MPIINIENSKQLEFGYGDIEVAPGLLKDGEAIGVVCFFENYKTNPIGKHTEYKENKEVSIEETPVRMLFHKVESIDVVIWALQEAKKMMIDKKDPQ